MRGIYNILSSTAALIWLITGWVIYYVTNAVWSKEAFAKFIGGLSNNPLLQIPYIVFLICLVLNIIRAGREKFKSEIIGFLLWVFAPIGIFIFLSGYFVSSALRAQEWQLAGEGDSVIAPWQKEGLKVLRIDSSLKPEILDIQEEEGSFFAYEPKIILSDGVKEYAVGVFPPKKIKGTYYHILNFGLGPGIRLLNPEGAIIKEGFLALRILPPGAIDNFEIAPYRFSIRLAPDRFIKKGNTEVKVFSLVNPSYNVSVYKGEELIFEGDSKDAILFDNIRVEFTPPTYWTYLEVVKDPGMGLILLGIALIFIGVISFPIRLIIKIIKA